MKKLSKEKDNERDNILIEIARILKDDSFNKDIITICEKYKLYPIENWLQPIMVYIGFDHMVPPDFLLGAGMRWLPFKGRNISPTSRYEFFS